MKLLKTILLIAVHGAQASHKVTTNAVEAETTQSLAVEAATATFIKMPGAVAKLFGRAEGAEVPAKQAQGPVEQHQDHFKAGHAPGKVDIYYLGVEGPPADFVLVDTKSGVEHRIPIEAGTHITYDNAVYEHRVDANPDSKRTMLGPASLPSGGRRLEAVGGCSDGSCTPCCTGGEENCEVAGCGSGQFCLGCEPGYTGEANKPSCAEDCLDDRRKLRAGGRKALFANSEPDVTLADGCCFSDT